MMNETTYYEHFFSDEYKGNDVEDSVCSIIFFQDLQDPIFFSLFLYCFHKPIEEFIYSIF